MVTAVAPANSAASVVYLASSTCLLALAVVSLFTGFRIAFLPFRLCPLVFTGSAALIALGWMLI